MQVSKEKGNIYILTIRHNNSSDIERYSLCLRMRESSKEGIRQDNCKQFEVDYQITDLINNSFKFLLNVPIVMSGDNLFFMISFHITGPLNRMFD